MRAGEEPAAQPSAAHGGRATGSPAEPRSAAPGEAVLAAGRPPPHAVQPARWLMIVSDDADFAPAVRAAAAAGWGTVVVTDRPATGAGADVCLSWQEVQGPVP